jgi:hypothetical protein
LLRCERQEFAPLAMRVKLLIGEIEIDLIELIAGSEEISPVDVAQ